MRGDMTVLCKAKGCEHNKFDPSVSVFVCGRYGAMICIDVDNPGGLPVCMNAKWEKTTQQKGGMDEE